LTDPVKLSEWQAMVVEARQESPGPMGKGTRIIDVRNFLGRRFESTLLITAFEPNKRNDFMSVSGPLPFRISHTLEAGDGATTIHVEAQGEPGGFFRLAESLVARQAERQVRSDYTRLKNILEAPAT
ncbi:MAG: hypothetical protein M3P18_00245, partial [Actinomycetota bacterium]|nr:hypothetical protein [Actinomycetota bacterium]